MIGPDGVPLPEGWAWQKDEATGRLFYFHETGEPWSQWQRPTHAVGSLPQPAEPTLRPGNGLPLPIEGLEEHGFDFGEMYLWCTLNAIDAPHKPYDPYPSKEQDDEEEC